MRRRCEGHLKARQGVPKRPLREDLRSRSAAAGSGRSHQRLADQHRVDPWLSSAASCAAEEMPDSDTTIAPGGIPAISRPVRVEVDREVAQVAVVDADDLRADRRGARELRASWTSTSTSRPSLPGGRRGARPARRRRAPRRSAARRRRRRRAPRAAGRRRRRSPCAAAAGRRRGARGSRSSSEPPKFGSSVRIDAADRSAPLVGGDDLLEVRARSCSEPAEGERRLNSAITPMPGAASASRKRPPREPRRTGSARRRGARRAGGRPPRGFPRGSGRARCRSRRSRPSPRSGAWRRRRRPRSLRAPRARGRRRSPRAPPARPRRWLRRRRRRRSPRRR